MRIDETARCLRISCRTCDFCYTPKVMSRADKSNKWLSADFDTDMGGPQTRFPSTHHSAIAALRGPDECARAVAYEQVLAAYWKPAYKYLRYKREVTNEDAKDLIQSFLARAFEQRFFEKYDSARASFQTFFRVCLDRFVHNELMRGQRLKRSPGQFVDLDFNAADQELANQPAVQADPDAYFHNEWVRNVFVLALEDLRRSCTETGWQIRFELFSNYDLVDQHTRPTYKELSARFEISQTTVTNHLAAVRLQFRTLVLQKLRQLTANETEFRSQARSLLGVDV